MSDGHWARLSALDGVTVAVVVTVGVLGAAILGGLVYADLTTSLDSDYEAYQQACDDLPGQTQLVERGIGMETVVLNDSAARTCENTTDAQYRERRYRSMQSTPLNPKQWLWYGGAGLLFLAGSVLLLRRQVAVLE